MRLFHNRHFSLYCATCVLMGCGASAGDGSSSHGAEVEVSTISDPDTTPSIPAYSTNATTSSVSFRHHGFDITATARSLAQTEQSWTLAVSDFYATIADEHGNTSYAFFDVVDAGDALELTLRVTDGAPGDAYLAAIDALMTLTANMLNEGGLLQSLSPPAETREEIVEGPGIMGPIGGAFAVTTVPTTPATPAVPVPPISVPVPAPAPTVTAPGASPGVGGVPIGVAPGTTVAVVPDVLKQKELIEKIKLEIQKTDDYDPERKCYYARATRTLTIRLADGGFRVVTSSFNICLDNKGLAFIIAAGYCLIAQVSDLQNCVDGVAGFFGYTKK